MKRYDYLAVVTSDVLRYLKDNEIEVTLSTRDEVAELLTADLLTCDSVTGNGSGSYTCSSYEAEENLCHNWRLLSEALDEFECDASAYLTKGAEACDVLIRCYLLDRAISAALDEIIA